MTTKLTGSCLCGGLRFEGTGQSRFQGFCQCLDCRKASGGRYAAIGMPEAAVTIPELFKPQSVVYAKRAVSWDYIDPSLPRFAELPPTT